MVLVLAGGASALETLVVPQGTTHTVTGKETYDSFEVAGTLIVEKGGELTAGLGTEKPRCTIDGLEAKVIVNGGVINLNSRRRNSADYFERRSFVGASMPDEVCRNRRRKDNRCRRRNAS
jgi:hypothetical protein